MPSETAGQVGSTARSCLEIAALQDPRGGHQLVTGEPVARIASSAGPGAHPLSIAMLRAEARFLVGGAEGGTDAHCGAASRQPRGADWRLNFFMSQSSPLLTMVATPA